ncbi:casein kinase substrate phospho protein PP28-domain-containing protein [Rhizophagus diaphanus]|nr:casein kinase substrate phospho protein PP28-domain-containing protein [Rhizophagus diaphanus] [Rhizophagus sp. MUCL 43196]
MPPKKNNRKWKVSRGGGHKFTNPRQLSGTGNEEGMWGYRDKKEDDSEEESEDETPNVSSSKIEKSKNNKNSQGSDKESGEDDGDIEDDDDDDDDDDENRSKLSSLSIIDIENPNRTKKDNLKASDIKDTPREMTRREREAAEKAASQQRYWKLHQEGKTEQAKADLERLAIIKKQREEAAVRRKAEQEAKAEAHKAKIASQGRKIKK